MSKKEKRPAALQSGEAQDGSAVEQNTSLAVPEKRQVLSLDVDRIKADCLVRINAALRKTAEGILETGRELNRAKAELPYNAWLEFVRSELPISEDVAQRFMRIAATPALETADPRFLPASVDALYAMTLVDKKLGEGTLARWLDDDTFSEKTTKQQVIAMWRPKQEKKNKGGRETKLAKELEAAQAHAAELEATFADPDELERLREENHALKRENLALQSEVEELRAALGKQALPLTTSVGDTSDLIDQNE